jgi:iron complex outermembrane receptor protein
VAGADGSFRLDVRALSGASLLQVSALGYRPRELRLAELRRSGAPGSGGVAEISLRPEPLAVDGVQVVVPGTRLQGGSGTVSVFDGEGLTRRQGTSVAALLDGEAGVTTRFNGPAATQPVIRGLTGDRVLVLEDGLRTGDIASTAPDHAITVDPMTADRLELIRGPAGVLYGSNALGGVVNVVREDIPLEEVEGPVGSLRLGGESATGSRVVAGHGSLPVGALALRVGGSLRETEDTRTPGGPLPFTDLSAHDLGAGLGWRGRSAAAGASVRHLRGTYGVPSSFAGLALPGAHDGGVYVDYTRTVGRGRLEWDLGRRSRPAASTVASPRRDPGGTSLVASGSAVRFEQSEYEEGGFVGTRFGQLAASGDLVLRREGRGRWAVSAVGVHAHWRDFRAEGSFTGTRPAVHRGVALYALQELRLGPAALVGAARWDRMGVSPLDSTETRLLRGVRTRSFDALTGAVGVRVQPGAGLSLGLNLTRSFRPPAVEELFSAGPHLASYAYEIGNPDLDPETGLGVDLLVAWNGAAVDAEVALFRNALSHFIGYFPALDPGTGEPLRDPRLRRYNVYRADQADARFVGGEATLRVSLSPVLALRAAGSWVRGSWAADGAPLPAVPPARGRVTVTRDVPRWFASVTLEGVARQDRVPEAPAQGASCDPSRGLDALLPAEFCPTPGALLTHVELGLRLDAGGLDGTVVVAADNVFDRSWRDHLWRAKQVAPQPGRNVRIFLTLEP